MGEDIAQPYMPEPIEETYISESYHDSVFEVFEAAT